MDSRFPDLDSIYKEIVLDHYRCPRGRKAIADPEVENQGLNPVCGDEVTVSLKIRGDRIEDVAVNGRGCAISVASGSMLAELLVGKSRAEVESLAAGFRDLLHGRPVPCGVDLGDLEALEGVRVLPVRVKCAMLAWTTLIDALKYWDSGKSNVPRPSTTESRP